MSELGIPDNLKKEMNNKRLIFTITTGRSGTGFLSRLLKIVPNVDSFHEPKPKFSEVMRTIQTEPQVAYQFWINHKLPNIVKNKNPVYIETSHLFCKGFLEPLLDIGFVPDVIVLRRAYRDVALSLYQLETIPGRTEKGNKYYLTPNDPGVVQIDNWKTLHDYQLCYWYCIEIDRRRKHYSKLLSQLGARIVNITLDQLLTFKGMRNLIEKLNLRNLSLFDWFKFYRLKNIRVNTKEKQKMEKLDVKYLDELEHEIDNCIQN